jgi:hypothetical protein
MPNALCQSDLVFVGTIDRLDGGMYLVPFACMATPPNQARL